MDVCPDALDQQVFDAMVAAGLPLEVAANSVLCGRSMTAVQTYVLPSDRQPLTVGACLALEPLYSRGIYRPIPRGARVSRLEACLLDAGSALPIANARLVPVLKRAPLGAYDAADDVVLFSVAVDEATRVLSSARNAFALDGASELVKGAFVALSDFTCAYGDKARAPCFLAEDRHVALLFEGPSGAAFPADAAMQIDVTYELPRTAEAFEG
jgi:hypothetical protein